jgi:hypothetical protein
VTMEIGPYAEKCSCNLASKSPKLHDWLLGFEDLYSIDAVLLATTFLSDEDPNTYLPSEVAGEWWDTWDPDEFEYFVSRHNWKDPVSMAEMAHLISFAANQNWEARKRSRKAA